MARSLDSLISVVVPVYNAERYLAACLDSLLAQTYQELEILAVDDGSTDRSYALCKEYAAKDRRVRVIHQENQGVGAARNTGIQNATGGYISFVDSDDYVKADYFEQLYQDMIQYCVDIVCCNLVEIYQGKIVQMIPTPMVRKDRCIIDSRTLYEDVVLPNEIYWSCVTVKLIRMELAKQFRFPSLKYGEDQIYMFDLFSTSPSVYLDSYQGYYYVRNDTSATLAKRAYSIIRCADELEMYEYKLTHLPNVEAGVKNRYIDQWAIAIHSMAKATEITGTKEERKMYRSMLCEKIQKALAHSGPISKRTKLYLRLYQYLPWLYRWLFTTKKWVVQQ